MIRDGDIARLQALLEQCHERHRMILSIAIEWDGRDRVIKPFVVDPPMYTLSYHDWQTLAQMVEQWYMTTTDQAIEYLNAQVAAEAAARDAEQNLMDDESDGPTPGWIYILSGGGYYKIGKTTQLDRRLSQIEPRLPFAVELLWYIRCEDIDSLESELHNHFAGQRTNGEWFALTAGDIDWIRSYAQDR